MCCVILSKAACGAQCPRTKLLQYETLRHMPTSVVYLSAAAAVKDSGIRVGRKVRCVGASVVNSPCIRKENSSLMFAAHAPAPPKFRTICRKQQTRVRAPASAYAVEQPVILPGSWGYITPAGRAAALQRDLQDSKQLTSLPPWHASSCRRCACGWRGALWWVVVGLREREREFGMDAQSEEERIGQRNRAKIPHWHSWWLMIKWCRQPPHSDWAVVDAWLYTQ